MVAFSRPMAFCSRSPCQALSKATRFRRPPFRKTSKHGEAIAASVVIRTPEIDPVAPLRAPLLWILLPWIAGLVAADTLMPHDFMPIFAIGLVFSLTGIWTVTRQKNTRWLWAIFFIEGVFCLSAARYFQVEGSRKTTSSLLDLPPRELVFDIHIERLFYQKNDSVKFSGLGHVRWTPDVRRDLIGKRIYFRLAGKNQGGGLIEGDRIRALGVLYPCLLYTSDAADE